MNFNKNTAIFDLDGTVLDSMQMWNDIDYNFLKDRGFDVPDDYVENIRHLPLNDCAIYTKNRFNLSESTDEIISCWDNMARVQYENYIELKEYVIDYLKILKENGIKLAVATGLTRELYTMVLTRLNIIEYFDFLASVDDVKKGKNLPDIYLYVAKNLNSNPSDCVVYEDIYEGLKSAKDAGMTACAVWDKSSEGNTKIKDICDYYVKTWKELI